jgi:1-carboxybiuret hydrolase subunit AtzG-like
MARRPAGSKRTRKSAAGKSAPRKATPRKTASRKRAGKKAARRAPPPKPKLDPLDYFIAAGARSLNLKIAKSWMPAVRTHLQVTLRHGALVAAFALADDAEPAPVFEA